MGAGLDPLGAASGHYRTGPVRPSPTRPRATPAPDSGPPSNGRRASPKLVRTTLLATVGAAPVALAVRAFRGTASSPKTMGRVLVHLAMLSTASGWELPQRSAPETTFTGEAHESPSTGGVDGPRDRRRLASGCNGCYEAWDRSCECDALTFWGAPTSCECDGKSNHCDWDCNSGCGSCPSGQYGAASTSLVARVPLRSRQAAHARAPSRGTSHDTQTNSARARAQVRARRFASPTAPSMRDAPRVRPARAQSTRLPPAARPPTGFVRQSRSARIPSTTLSARRWA